MIQTQFELSIGQRLVLIMANGTRTPGIVRWIHSDLAGIQFDAATPLSAMLDREFPTHTGARRRMPRLDIAVSVVVTDHLGVKGALTCDISVAGARLSCRERLMEGPIKLELPSYPPIGARILWGVSNQFGCIFDRSFTIDELTGWLRSVE